jgi:hypothetical protein
MKSLFIILISLLLIASCQKENAASQDEKAFEERSVSMVRLLANPELYDGKEVQVVGFYRQGFEEFAVYPSREMSIDPSNGVWVEMNLQHIEKVKPDGSWIVLKGTFDANAHGHLGKYTAILKNISKKDVIDSLFDIVVLGKEQGHAPTK